MNYFRHQNYKNKYFKPITVSTDDMDKFEEKDIMKKGIFTKSTWYD